MPHGEILALDVGTRTIMGLVLERTGNGGFRILALEQHEHRDRVMYEGQVHDVAAVAESVAKVKAALEKRRQTTYNRAAVAAAGRSLVMSRGEAQHRRPGLSAVTEAEIEALELEALRSAQAQLVAEQGSDTAAGFFCVGYSVSHYLLDGEPISHLLGQVSSKIGVELIATFLPRVVVNALFSVLQRANLEPASLTLEPIAALEVSVPSGMRQLNLTLLDVGAGTADIALVRKGRVFAYGMVPLAGDKITDALCQEYLLDFSTAETVKKLLSEKEEVAFTDILGTEHRLPVSGIIANLEPLVAEMAAEIASQILSLNGGPPDAVLMVGGGSLTPALPQALSEALGLPRSRVGIRTREMVDTVTGYPEALSGPQGVTPLGIAVTSFGQGPLHFIDVTVNQQPIPLWQGAGQTVADALLAAGGNWTQLFGRPGLAVTAKVNGRLEVIPGGQGQAPILLVNGQASTLDAELKPGDRIEFTPGANGKPARATVRDLIKEKPTLTVNGNKVAYPAKIFINGKIGQLDSPVRDRAQITIEWERPLTELLIALGVNSVQAEVQNIPFYLDGHHHTFTYCPGKFHLNGQPAKADDLVRPGDVIQYEFKRSQPTIGSAIADYIQPQPSFKVMVNGEELEFPTSSTGILVNGQPGKLEDPLRPNADIALLPGRTEYIVSDLFALIDVKKEAAPGARLVMIVNGKEATFTTPLKPGDQVSLSWNKQAQGGD